MVEVGLELVGVVFEQVLVELVVRVLVVLAVLVLVVRELVDSPVLVLVALLAAPVALPMDS